MPRMASQESADSVRLNEAERRVLQRVVRTAHGTHAAQRATVLPVSYTHLTLPTKA